jgi:hypothetical protein
VFGVIFLIVLNQFIQRQLIREALIFLSVSCFVSYLLLYLFEPKYKRYEAEQKSQGSIEENVGIISVGDVSTKDNENFGIDSRDQGHEISSSSDSESISF